MIFLSLIYRGSSSEKLLILFYLCIYESENYIIMPRVFSPVDITKEEKEIKKN